ncbi:MAG: KH domain-containing protein [Myxococcaceae bacterium]|nr:KH domain-containing protein [Myxococcaceae bacterium]MCI0670704.1 KH domain-containing protein [Myxococcaceae bacterium]
MEGLILYIARGLVDAPEQVEVKASDAEGVRLFELKVAPGDVGKVIGRDGRTVNALRTLLSAAAQKQGVKARLELLDDRRNPPAATPPSAAPATES